MNKNDFNNASKRPGTRGEETMKRKLDYKNAGRAATTSVFTKAVAVVTALSLVFLQVPITNYAGQALADATEEAQEQLATQSAIDVPLTFEHAYIIYEGQVIGSPATMVTLPAGSPMQFSAAADGGYQLEGVVATINGTDITLSADGSGMYTLTAADVATTSNITVRAITAPTVEGEVTVEEGAEAEGEADAADEAAAAEAAEAIKKAEAENDANAAAIAATEANARTKFSYEDADVEVTAALSSADAVPANATFQVKPITSSSTGYNYGVLMDALNESASDVEYTAENTLLYDIAFMVPKTDKDGKVIEGEFVEYEPAAGTVTITVTFKKNQLSSGIDAERNSDVEVIHLPLSNAALDAAESTEKATGITVGDVSVESVSQAATSVADEKVSFTLNSLSPTAITTAGARDLAPATLGGTREVTNATPSSNDLANFLTGATFNAPQNAQGQYVVTPGTAYTFTLAFAETPRLQFPDDGSVMSYRLPDGLDAADGQRGSLNIKVNDGGVFSTVSGNEYWIEGGVLYFKFNTNDPNYSKLTAASNTKKLRKPGTVCCLNCLHQNDLFTLCHVRQFLRLFLVQR